MGGDTGEGIDKFRDPRDRELLDFEGLGNDVTAGSSSEQRRHNLGRKPRLSRSHREERDHLVDSQAEMVFRVIESHRCWKTAPATCGSGWMTDCIYSRMDGSEPIPGQIASRWVLSPGSQRTSIETFGQSASASRRKLVRIRDFQVR